MPHGGNRAAVNQVTEQTVAVGGHRDQVTVLLFRGFQNLGWWIAKRQVDARSQAFLSKPVGQILQISAIGNHLFRLCQPELLVVPRHPPVGYMNEE